MRSLSLAIVALLAIAITAACAREGTPLLAPVDVTVAELPDAGLASSTPLATPPTSTGPRDRCSARLRAQPIKTGAGCTLDERISKGTGTLSYPCSGEGAVEATFGEHRFEGSIAGGAIVLALTTELDWEDGCHWQTRQGLRGEWHRDREEHSKLAWSYTERPIRGTGCYGSCKASADIEIIEDTP